MRKARRWNNESSKLSILDDLFPGSERPKHRRSGAVRPAAMPRRESFALETIETRLLLSADLSLIADNHAVDVTTPLISPTQTVVAVNNGTTTIVDASPSSI